MSLIQRHIVLSMLLKLPPQDTMKIFYAMIRNENFFPLDAVYVPAPLQKFFNAIFLRLTVALRLIYLIL
jgi:hypothetical protein